MINPPKNSLSMTASLFRFAVQCLKATGTSITTDWIVFIITCCVVAIAYAVYFTVRYIKKKRALTNDVELPDNVDKTDSPDPEIPVSDQDNFDQPLLTPGSEDEPILENGQVVRNTEYISRFGRYSDDVKEKKEINPKTPIKVTEPEETQGPKSPRRSALRIEKENKEEQVTAENENTNIEQKMPENDKAVEEPNNEKATPVEEQKEKENKKSDEKIEQLICEKPKEMDIAAMEPTTARRTKPDENEDVSTPMSPSEQKDAENTPRRHRKHNSNKDNTNGTESPPAETTGNGEGERKQRRRRREGKPSDDKPVTEEVQPASTEAAKPDELAKENPSGEAETKGDEGEKHSRRLHSSGENASNPSQLQPDAPADSPAPAAEAPAPTADGAENGGERKHRRRRHGESKE